MGHIRVWMVCQDGMENTVNVYRFVDLCKVIYNLLKLKIYMDISLITTFPNIQISALKGIT